MSLLEQPPSAMQFENSRLHPVAHHRPRCASPLASKKEVGDGTARIAERRNGNLTVVLLASLNPAAVAGGADLGDAVRIDGAVLSRSDLVGAATSVAERVADADRVAVLAPRPRRLCWRSRAV